MTKDTWNNKDPVKYIYEEYEEMRDVMTAGYKEFNYSESKERDRNLVEFLDDNQKRANSYVPSKDSQDKEGWQANVFTQYTRDKIKAHIASVAKQPPEITIRAVNDKNELSVERGNVMEKLVKASYYEGNNNPEITAFFDSWNCAINGTVIKYDGYLKNKVKKQVIKSYNLATGKIEVEDQEEVIAEDRCIELDIPLQNFFISDPYIADIQQQPVVIWVSFYNSDEFDYEFGKYKNAEKVKEAGYKFSPDEMKLFYGEDWNDRVEAEKIEIIRYYNRFKNKYCIIANGVLLLDTIMLWGKKRKNYPFAKSIYEPFANINFFWGNSLPNILMGNQDIANAFINSMVDKTYRSLNAPMLVGMVNRDAFELEDEYVSGDTRIYVDDINQVSPMPQAGVNQSEVKMLEIISKGIDVASTDALQSGYGGTGSTAREIVLANERAEELKGLFFLLLKDLYVQKTRLRILNILMNYNKKEKVLAFVGEDGQQIFDEQFKTFNVPNQQLASGEMGTTRIGIADIGEIAQLNKPIGMTKEGQKFNEMDIRQEQYRLQGQSIELMMINSDFLDDWEYYVEVDTTSFYQRSRALDKALEMEKIEFIARLFPQLFMANQPEFFKDLLKFYKDSPDKYLEKLGQAAVMPMMPTVGGVGAVTSQVAQPTQSLPKLAGVE